MVEGVQSTNRQVFLKVGRDLHLGLGHSLKVAMSEFAVQYELLFFCCVGCQLPDLENHWVVHK